MGFNLTTFLAQIVNLFLLIWLLKHFLYRPVLNIIDKRRKEIEDSVKDANQQLSEAEKIKENLARQEQNFDKLRQKRLDELDRDIQQQKAQMLKELELNYRTRRQKLQDDLDRSWHTAEANIQEMIGSEFMLLSQKILTEWSNQTPTEQMLALFGKKISTLPAKKRAELQKLLAQEKSIQITTPGVLSKKQQDTLKNILSQNFVLPKNMRFHYKKRPDLVLGLEIRVGEFVLDWNLNTYLNEMNQHLKEGIAGLIIPAKRKADK